MTLGEFTALLHTVDALLFRDSTGKSIPAHFHITEIGLLSKSYMDCGGVLREEKTVSLQIWVAGDLEHRLTPQKLLKIIEMSKSWISDDSLPLEIEYQETTIGKYGLAFGWAHFHLVPLFTTCLAQDKCGIRPDQLVQKTDACCASGGCC